MKRNVTIWIEDGQYVLDFATDLQTNFIWKTGPGLDITRVVNNWIEKQEVPHAATCVLAPM